MEKMDSQYEERHLSIGIVIEASLLGLTGLLLCLAFFIFNIRFRHNRMIKMTSPNLNLILAIGGILLSACCAMYGLDYFLTDSVSAGTTICQVRAGLLACGFSLLYGPMLAKAWRVYRLFREAGTRRVIIRDSQLLLLTAALLLADVILVVIWQSTDPLIFCAQLVFPQMEPNSDATSLQPVRIVACTGEHAHSWLAGLLVLKLALLSYGLFLSWQTRAVALPSMNDSRCIVVSTMTTITMATFAVSISYLLHDRPDAVYACVVLAIWLCAIVGTCMAFIPKIALWWRNPEGKGIRMSVSSSTCSACSMAVLHPVEQIEEELGQAAAENGALRKSLEERDASIRKLHRHLNSAQSKLSQLGLGLDQKQDSGLDADLSFPDHEDGRDAPLPRMTGVSFGMGSTPLNGLWKDRPLQHAHSDTRSELQEQVPYITRPTVQTSRSSSGSVDSSAHGKSSRTGPDHLNSVERKLPREEFQYYDSFSSDEILWSGCYAGSNLQSVADRTDSGNGTTQSRRGSNQTDNTVYTTSSRRNSDYQETVKTRRSRRDSRQQEHGPYTVNRRRNSAQRTAANMPKDRRSSSLGDMGLRRVTTWRESDTAVVAGRRFSRSETNSDRSYRRRRQHRYRHSATSITSLDRLSTLRNAIAQDLKHARSLSNLLGDSLSRDLNTVHSQHRRHVRRRSSSGRSHKELTGSIVSSYGLEDNSDTYSFVSSFLPSCPATFTPDIPRATSPMSVLANDCLYPDRRHTEHNVQSKFPSLKSPSDVTYPQPRANNPQDVYTIQIARNPEFLNSGYAQTRVLCTSDTFI